MTSFHEIFRQESASNVTFFGLPEKQFCYFLALHVFLFTKLDFKKKKLAETSYMMCPPIFDAFFAASLIKLKV